MKSSGYLFLISDSNSHVVLPLHDDQITPSLEVWFWFVVLVISYLISLSALPHMSHLLTNSNHANLVHVWYQAHTSVTWRHGTDHVYLIAMVIRLIYMLSLQPFEGFQRGQYILEQASPFTKSKYTFLRCHT